MKILLVEDDQNKLNSVSSLLKSNLPSEDLVIRRSFQSGLKEIIQYSADVIVLDMTLPTYDVTQLEPGGRERRYGGREILRQMKRKKITIPTILVTQYEQFEEEGRIVTLSEISEDLRKEYSPAYIGTVYYQAASSNWVDELLNYLRKIIDSGY